MTLAVAAPIKVNHGTVYFPVFGYLFIDPLHIVYVKCFNYLKIVKKYFDRFSHFRHKYSQKHIFRKIIDARVAVCPSVSLYVHIIGNAIFSRTN